MPSVAGLRSRSATQPRPIRPGPKGWHAAAVRVAQGLARPVLRSSGGRPDMAQAGGPDGANAAAALDAIEKALGQAG
ncbi:MAG: hypothetical protein IIC06_08975 [Proteobacteria bacterium]|nr:hypothetical protein [Pseudomonadota bacterium]